MYKTIRRKKVLIKAEKFWMGQSFFCLTRSQLRIRKCDPDLFYFIWCEVFSDAIDLNSQKSNIRKLKLQCFFRPYPDPVSFLINTNKISLRMKLTKSHGILTFPAC